MRKELNKFTYNKNDMLIVLELAVNQNWIIDFIIVNQKVRNYDHRSICRIMNELRNGLVAELTLINGTNVYNLK